MVPSRILEETIHLIRERVGRKRVLPIIDEIRIGVFFTGVSLASGHAGVAFTPIKEIPEAVCCPTSARRMPDAGKITRKGLEEVLAYGLSSNPIKSSIGVALLNALSHYLFQNDPAQHYDIRYNQDGLDSLEITLQDMVCLVGAFAPYIRRFKTSGNEFFIIEKTPDALKPEEMKNYRAPGEAAKVLRSSDVIIITGAAVVNHTIDELLKAAKPDSRIGIVGPTASMVPDAFFKRGVDIMAGVRIKDSGLMLHILGEGGSGYHLSHACAQKVVLVKNGREKPGEIGISPS